ncbi:hypothetical protein Tco_0570040 [Tanacetum coccineum]
MARMVKTGTRIGPSKSSQSLSIAHKWAVVIDLRAICLLSFIIILLGFSGHQNGFKIAFNSILQFPAAGLTVDYFSIDILRPWHFDLALILHSLFHSMLRPQDFLSDKATDADITKCNYVYLSS